MSSFIFTDPIPSHYLESPMDRDKEIDLHCDGVSI